LYKLLADIESWKANLPENLRFRGADSPQSAGNERFLLFPCSRSLRLIFYSFAGILHLLYTSVCMIFWRVFMRISYSCPEHLKFGLTVEQWSLLVTMTGDSIDWLDANEKVYDVWLLFAYAATSCAFVQVGYFHSLLSLTASDVCHFLRIVSYMGAATGHGRCTKITKVEGLRTEMGGLDIAGPHVGATQGPLFCFICGAHPRKERPRALKRAC
jgi:hypothetical protein